MDNLITSTIENVLREMQSNAQQLHPNFEEAELKKLMQKYNAMFLGEKINQIYSFDVLDYVKKHYNLMNLTKDEFNAMLPDICKRLNMQCHPMIRVQNMQTREVDSYQITLF